MIELKKEQKDAIFHDKGSVLVSASAGSGKTFVMIQRLIRLIEEGKANLDEILAVTYTDSAAADMREKLKKALYKSIKEGKTSLCSAVNEIDTADISTMHAFCGRLIRKYFYVAGVSPDFKIADTALAGVILNESLEKTFKSAYAKANQDFLEVVDKFSHKRFDTPLRELIVDLYQFVSVEADPIDFAKRTVEQYSINNFENLCKIYNDKLQSTMQRVESLLKESRYGFERTENQKYLDFIDLLLGDLSLIEKDNVYSVKRLEGAKRRMIGASAKGLDEYNKKLLVEAKGLFDQTIEDYCKHLTDSQTDKETMLSLERDAKCIVELLSEFIENYTKAKREENLLDFSDLEHLALKVLEDQTVLETLKAKYKYIFFDEYQDVNGVQEEIISRLSTDNVFMVGDLKQSIYGFRGSRAEFFVEKLNTMPQKGQKTLSLNHNFRSANAVIDMVNDIFTHSMTMESSGVNYSETKLNAGGLFKKDALGRATIHAVKKPKGTRAAGETPRIYNLLQEINTPKKEKESITANLLTNIIESELHKKFYDPKIEDYRQVTYGDIAILTRNRDNAFVEGIVNGLASHGIPVISEVSQKICQFPEVQTLINALKLIDCYTGDVALATTLKSAIGGFTDEDLAQIVVFAKENNQTTDGFSDAYRYFINNDKTQLGDKLREFDSKFKTIRELADFYGAHDILEKLINDSGYKAVLYAGRQGETKIKRVKKFLSLSVSGGKKYTVKEFLSVIENDNDSFECAEIADEDTVKVMTMHASKGLEFPVVIVCGLERSFGGSRSDSLYLKDREYGFAIKYFDKETRTRKETILRGIIKERQKEQAVKEEMRLFYVATTRATYSLHLAVEGELKDGVADILNAKRFTDYFPNDIPAVYYEQEDLEFERMKNDVRKVIIGKANEQDVDRIKKNFAFTYQNQRQTKMPLKSSASNVMSDIESNSLVHYVVTEEDKTDTQRGDVAHKVMEYYSFTSEKTLKEQVVDIISKGVLTKEQIELINLDRLENALKSPVFDQLKGKKLFREKSFISSVNASLLGDFPSTEKVLVQGVIDLLAIDQTEACIIDYKYSSLTPKSLEQKYKKQLDIYKDAVQNALKIKVKDTVLINLFSGDVINIR